MGRMRRKGSVSRLAGTLHGIRVFTGAERNRRAFSAEFEAFEEIAYRLAQAVVAQCVELHLIDELPGNLSCFVTHHPGARRRRVFLAFEIGIKQVDELLRRGGRGGAGVTVALQERDQATRHSAGVRQI